LHESRGRAVTVEHMTPPSRPDLLPPELAYYITHQDDLDKDNPHQSVLQGNGHHGSHPHLVHEFIRSIMEERKSRIDAVTAANWTAAGIMPIKNVLINAITVNEAKDSSEIENIITIHDELFNVMSHANYNNSAAKEVMNYRTALYQPSPGRSSRHTLILK
jgi:hypothetical protein